MPDKQSLTFDAYQEAVVFSDRGPKGLAFPLLGLFGETGGLLSVIKKRRRDRGSPNISYRHGVVDELGDVLWYLASLATRARIRLADVAFNANRDSEAWSSDTVNDLTFSAIQVAPHTVPLEPS